MPHSTTPTVIHCSPVNVTQFCSLLKAELDVLYIESRTALRIMTPSSGGRHDTRAHNPPQIP